jgi:hypothetical protein
LPFSYSLSINFVTKNSCYFYAIIISFEEKGAYGSQK